MKGFVKIIALILILASIPLSLTSCDRSYDEAEVMEAATKLIAASAELNEIYYGKGIAYLADSAHNISLYCEADPMSLEKYGIKNIAQLQEKTLLVFSESHAESMFKSAFSGSFSQNGGSNLSRYYQKYDSKGVTPICIMVNSSYEPVMNAENVYDMSTLKVIGSKKEYVYVSIEVTITSGEKSQEQTLDIRLIEEENGWRISSTTFANYNELQDIYNDLQKN